ncbi:MAG: GGDEF domain-containing protein [Mogibacterium sp.]|nr:GGDEF domain-containing protein [Mogibacterium sp.]
MKFSLKRKSVLLIIVVMVLVGIATLLCFYRGINDIIRDQYRQQSISLSRSVALNVNPDNTQAVRDAVMEIYNSIPEDQRFSSKDAGAPGYDEYHERFAGITKMVEYQMLLTQIQKILEETEAHDVSIGWADKASGAYIYLTDATTDPDFFIEPGSFKHISEHNSKTLDAPGLGFEPEIIEGDGIQLISSAMPIYDKNFHVTGFAQVDIDMENAISQMKSYMRILGGLLVLILVITTAVLIRLVDRSIVRPINMLADASACYCNLGSNSGSDSSIDSETKRIRFSDLRIRTRDEIEGLANSMAQMERDIDDYIASLTETRVQLNTTTEYAKKMDRIAYIDALTGVRNKRSYGDALDELANDIQAGIAKFGIGVVDLNNLKTYNDTYGHEKGDIAIRTICELICETFKHSPVFRYGGDEFAIILEGHDLRFIDDLIADLKKKTEELKNAPELEEWQKVSAAIGYAVFDPDIDTSPDTVFKRADNAMYRDKKAMKAAAATSD